jgi:hypothetical protein
VRLVAGIKELAALGLILPGLVRLPPATVTVAALVLPGSRLIDLQSQNMTVAARATAERKVVAHLS